MPVPETVDNILSRVSADDSPLLEVLTRQIKDSHRVVVSLESWQPEQLDDYYRMNYRVVDQEGRQLGQGRNLEKVLDNFKEHVSETLQQQTQQRFETDSITQWDFGELPLEHQFKQAGVTVTSYPALVDRKDSVAIELKDYPQQAQFESGRGMVRLFMFQLPQQVKYLRKELLRGNTINLQLAGVDQRREQWLEDLLHAVFYRVFIDAKELPRNQDQFNQRLHAGRQQLVEEAQALAQLLATIIGHYNSIRKLLKKANELSWAYAIGDINRQLAVLFAPGFIVDTPIEYLEQYPRYLQAIVQRLEKLRGHFQRDKQLSTALNNLSEPLLAVWVNNADAMVRSSQLLEFRWLLEEFRVSLFAQQLGTRQAVSEKRLREQWKQVKTALLDLSS